MPNPLRTAKAFFGPDTAPVSHTEKIISACGGFLGILLVYFVSLQFIGTHGSALVVASMGASAVLLFAVPHGQLSQPWSVIGGHLVSAVIGVSCAKLFHDPAIASATAVGLAIGAMYYLRCLHPPGGATALIAVVGGGEVHALGYLFVLTPVLINVFVILAVAVLVNYAFAWRRYPASLAKRPHVQHDAVKGDDGGEISHGDLVYALRKLDSFVDVSEEDLAEIFALANEHAHQTQLDVDDIHKGRAYSNGRYADDWSVRQIVDESRSPRPDKDQVIYKIVAGRGRRGSGMCTRQEFARWARYEVVRNENSWQRAPSNPAITHTPASPHRRRKRRFIAAGQPAK